MAKTTTTTKSVAEVPAPMHTLTSAQWGQNPSLQRELAALLEQPAFKLACQTILLSAIPAAQPVGQLQPGVSADALALLDSNRYHHRSGMTHFYRAIHALSRTAGVAKKYAEWGELLETED